MYRSQNKSKAVADLIDSPLPNPKPYTLKRSKIDFTMKYLDNSDTEGETLSFEIPQLKKRTQPKQICQPKLDLTDGINEDSDESSDTSLDDSLDSSVSQNYEDYQIKEYYDKYGKNPPWQKD